MKTFGADGGLPRRQFLRQSALATAAVVGVATHAAEPRKARVAVSLDLEMSRNFPAWEQTHWDYEKGNLDAATKRYAVEVARRVKARGGVVHFFLVGRALEQENVGWLKQLIADGHRVGNHTYDHVNVKAAKADQIQFRFQRAPWLIAGKEPAAVIRENIEQCTAAMKSRLGVAPNGFRTPGGFGNGLADAPQVQKILRELGFTWCSSKYPAHAPPKPGEEPDASVVADIVRAQAEAQPFRYPSGLVEVPMSPISDIGAFRTGRWKLEWFLRVTRAAVEHCIERGLVFDFLAHPSCLGVVDPECRTVEMICDLLAKNRERAELTDLEAVAKALS
ncbi:MAG: polysaccharide deacetylase family protein [Verrucomicrobia bacterium]|nr:polysaccharide deacetylase family protein [Verrucomicrobiota bacterium]